MKTILYVRADGIYSDSRASKELITLLRAGYRVLVIGWDREGNSEEKCFHVFQDYLKQIRFFMFDSQVKNHVGFRNIDKLYRWLRFVEKVLMKYRDEIDVVHAVNLDSILLCYKKCKKYGIKIIYDIFDYYVDNHSLIPALLRPIIESMEISIINHADVTIICTEERREQIAKAKPKKVIVIHNTPDVEKMENDIEYDYFYCGNLCKQRLIEEIFSEYKNNTDLKIGFAGYGLFKDKATEIEKEYDNFTYLGQVMYNDCLVNESKAICLSAIYEPTIRNHRLCAPNKFYESLALGKPIIACRGTGIDRIVEENSLGIVIDYDAKQFYEAIRHFRNNPEECKEIGKRSRKMYEEKYNWGIMSTILLNAYDQLLSLRKGNANGVKKLLFVGWYPNNIEKYRNVFFRNLIFAIADLGVECTVISPVSYMRYRNKISLIPKEEYQSTPNGNKVKVYYPRTISASSKQIGPFNTEVITERWFEDGAIRQAKILARRGEPFDAVYGHFFLYGGLAAIKIGRLLNLPSFVAFGECDYETQIQERFGDLKPKHIMGLRGVVSVSTKNANKLRELGIFDKIPIIVSPNAVDLTLFKRLDKVECREKMGLPQDKFIVGFVGGFIERKGDKRLLAAVNELNDVFLAFAGVPGSGQVAPSGDKVLFCKPLKHEEIPILLNAVDVFCLPTLSEGSCNAVAEALACGTPVISSNLSFNDDVLTDDNSIRIDPASVDEIRKAINAIFVSEELKKKLMAEGCKTAADMSIVKRAEKVVAFIQSNREYRMRINED